MIIFIGLSELLPISTLLCHELQSVVLLAYSELPNEQMMRETHQQYHTNIFYCFLINILLNDLVLQTVQKSICR